MRGLADRTAKQNKCKLHGTSCYTSDGYLTDYRCLKSCRLGDGPNKIYCKNNSSIVRGAPREF